MAKRNFVGAKGARLLRKVARHILAEPMRYNQNDIISRGKPGQPYRAREHWMYPACGTVACIGGWLDIFTMKKLPKIPNLNNRRIAKVLGIPPHHVRALVAGIGAIDGWPKEFEQAYLDAKTPRGRAIAADLRIKHFIKTGE
jgi:hypothetical protein